MNPLLKNVELFRSLPEDVLERVSGALSTRHLESKEILFNLGDPGTYLVIVESGQVAIYAPLPNDPQAGQAIRIFQPGDVLGEMALIDQKSRSLSARAETPAVVLTLGREEFLRLLNESSDLVLAVMSGLNDRIRYTTDFLSQVRDWVQRIANGSYQADDIMKSSDQYKDKTLVTLAAEFAQMASRVQEREEQLRKEVAMLRIEVDESKRKAEVAAITGSQEFLSLKEKVKRLREQGKT
ncbi:MAG TPA: cyclic nucleotide-binding domain-containing protein [Anaerolineales bacterium]|nr:cyclic nucleotide-binding domain-containing protein [Anaerolineales bacterium]